MYVDGFVMPVRKDRMEAYRRMAEMARDVCLANGATGYVEAVADDVKVGEVTSFPRAVQLEEDEIVVFSWITYPDKATRDSCGEAMMSDERFKEMMADPPFNMKRMIYGGFESIVVA